MDGTILDTLEDLKDSLNFALTSGGFPCRTLDEVRSFVGNGTRLLVERGLPQGTDIDTTNHIYAIFSEYYQHHSAIKTHPYEGISNLLLELRNKKILTAVVSNKPDYSVQELCRKYFPCLFDAAAGERASLRKKPSPDLVNELLIKLGVDSKDALYVGDSEVDLETAHNSFLDCVAVSWGFRDTLFLRKMGAETIIDSPSQLLSRLN